MKGAPAKPRVQLRVHTHYNSYLQNSHSSTSTNSLTMQWFCYNTEDSLSLCFYFVNPQLVAQQKRTWEWRRKIFLKWYCTFREIRISRKYQKRTWWFLAWTPNPRGLATSSMVRTVSFNDCTWQTYLEMVPGSFPWTKKNGAALS